MDLMYAALASGGWMLPETVFSVVIVAALVLVALGGVGLLVLFAIDALKGNIW